MSFSQKMFGFDGRIRRLPYFGFGILSCIVGGVLVGTGIVLMQVGFGFIPGIVVIIAAVAGMIWVSLALTVKRLHDMGLAGIHVIWFLLLNLAAGGARALSPGLGILLDVACFGVSLWLLFKRGDDGANQYGPPPEAMLRQDSFAT